MIEEVEAVKVKKAMITVIREHIHLKRIHVAEDLEIQDPVVRMTVIRVSKLQKHMHLNRIIEAEEVREEKVVKVKVKVGKVEVPVTLHQVQIRMVAEEDQGRDRVRIQDVVKDLLIVIVILMEVLLRVNPYEEGE